MTLLLRDRENIEKGRAEGRAELILSVLKKYSAEEAAILLNLSVEEVLKVQQDEALLL